MKVFISWSEEPSRTIAVALSEWLQNVTQHVEPWVSETEIQGGARWNDKVAKALNDTDFGIVCVTPANREKPWLMFEAGALAKHLDSAHVVPLLIDLGPTQITGPLATFQSIQLDKEGMRKLVGNLMSFRDRPPSKQSTNQLFERLWPDFEIQASEAKRRHPGEKVHRSTDDMLEEIVGSVRRIERGSLSIRTPIANQLARKAASLTYFTGLPITSLSGANSETALLDHLVASMAHLPNTPAAERLGEAINRYYNEQSVEKHGPSLKPDEDRELDGDEPS